MSMADLIPTLADPALKNLFQNAERLAAGPAGPNQMKAAELLPLIEAEMLIRKPPKPVKVVKAKAPAKPKAPSKKKAAAAETADAEG